MKKALRKFPNIGQRESAINYLIDGEISDDSEADTEATPTELPAPTESGAEAAASAPTTTTAAAVVAPVAPIRPKPRRIPIELQRLFARLQLLDAVRVFFFFFLNLLPCPLWPLSF